MPKCRATYRDGEIEGYIYECPGCMTIVGESGFHMVHTESPNPLTGARWSFNGNVDRPTFSPSVLARYPGEQPHGAICHHYVNAGRIQYLDDCTHELKGQTVDLPEWN